LPSHTHALQATLATADNRQPAGLASATSTGQVYAEIFDPQQMNASSITSVGGSRSHTNVMPFVCVHFIVALVGIYPSRH
jgi:microcystin-dependent protein